MNFGPRSCVPRVRPTPTGCTGRTQLSAVLLARALATDARRAAVREWTRMLAEGSAEHVPLLAEELQALAVESASEPAGSDLIWIQACLGLTMEAGFGLS